MDGKNVVEIYNGSETKLTKIPFLFFSRLQNVSKLLDQQYNEILLIQVIKESKRKSLSLSISPSLSLAQGNV